MNSMGLGEDNLYHILLVNGVMENLDLDLLLQENLTLNKMKKQILSILYITIVSFGFAQDFKIKS